MKSLCKKNFVSMSSLLLITLALNAVSANAADSMSKTSMNNTTNNVTINVTANGMASTITVPAGSMDGYVVNIEKKSLENNYFREVLFTGPHSQLVVMSIAPGEDIGMETHKDVDQFVRVEAGIGQAILNGTEYNLENGSAVIIPAGTKHNIINRSKSEPLKLYTIYSPANHPQGTINKDKAEAIAYEKERQELGGYLEWHRA